VDAATIYQYAVKHGARWPELVVAQWKLESGHGTAMSGANNPFGLKATTGGSVAATVEYKNGKPIPTRDRFINFSSQEEAVQYLVEKWYKDYRGFRGVNRAESAEDAARLLQSEGYATDPNYAAKLIRNMTSASRKTDFADPVDAAKSYKGFAHQDKAYRDLWATLSDVQKGNFTATWRSSPPVTTAPPVSPAPKFPLSVPYFEQNDSRTNQGFRMCQSSAIAMRIKQVDPKAIGDDDDYLKIVNRFGDTVSQSAHQRALDHLGFKHVFRQNGSEKDLCRLLDQGMAVPIGVLHRGPVSSPSGGGHWVTLVGYDATHFWVHDPNGEMDVVNGGYVTTRSGSGKNIRYTRKNLMKRWLIASQSDGWLWEIRR
jgi:hypothetical protein